MARPEHASHSQVSAWLRCQKQYELERLLEAPQAPATYLVTGNAVHSVLEAVSLQIAAAGRVVEVNRV